MTTNADTPFDFDTWWKLYEQLKGSPWEDEDIQYVTVTGMLNIGSAAKALKYAYDKAEEWEGPIDREDAVGAVLAATYEFHGRNTWTPLQVAEMADHFAIFHKAIEDPLQDYLDDHYGRMPLDWLTDNARGELEKGLRRDSEIWITESPAGVYVFYKPGHKP